MGLFENPYADESRVAARSSAPRSTAQEARLAAQRSMVLLRNERQDAAAREDRREPSP